MHISRKLNYYWAAAWLFLGAALLLAKLPSPSEVAAVVTAIGERIFEVIEHHAPDFAKQILNLEFFGNLGVMIIAFPIFLAAIISVLIQFYHVLSERVAFLIGIVVIGSWVLVAGFWFFISSYMVEYFHF